MTTGPIGVLLAAGRGRRMGPGTIKQLLPWPGPDDPERTMIGAAFDAIAPACEKVLVVLGHEAEAVRAGLGAREFGSVAGVDPDAPMYESVRAGLVAARKIARGRPVLLQPADQPEVAPTTLEAIRSAAAATPGRAVMPEVAGRGGHPVWIPAAMLDELIGLDGAGGLKAYWRAHPERCVRVPVDDAACVRDVDTPEGYGAARADEA